MRLSLGLLGLLLVLLIVGLSLRLALRSVGGLRPPATAAAGARAGAASGPALPEIVVNAPAASQPVVQQLQRDLAQALEAGGRHTQDAEDADAAKR